MGQAIYAAAQQAQAENPQGQDAESASSESGDDTVVDAEIVDDETRKSDGGHGLTPAPPPGRHRDGPAAGTHVKEHR